MDLLKKSYDPSCEDETSIVKRLNRVNSTCLYSLSLPASYRNRHLRSRDDDMTAGTSPVISSRPELSLSWMAGLDEVEDHLRQRSFLLHSLRAATLAVVRQYLRQPDRALTTACPAVVSLVDLYEAILAYELLPSVDGVWTVLQWAGIPSQLLRPTNTLQFAKEAIAFLLNTQVGNGDRREVQGLYAFFDSFSPAQWSQFYKNTAILAIPENVGISVMTRV